MCRYPILSLIPLLLVVGSAEGQAPVRFQWKAGDALTYAVEQTTTIRDTAPLKEGANPTTQVTKVKLTLKRRWNVTAVDPQGTATMTMSILSLRQEMTQATPMPETFVKDSADPKDAAEMAEYLNKPILTIQVDAMGKLLESPTAAPSPTLSRLRTELPFRLVLPADPIRGDSSWLRPFSFTVDPPAGTGEKYDLKQSYRVKQIAGPVLTLEMGTEIVNPPKSPTDLQSLLPLLWTGEVQFDSTLGRYKGSKLSVRKELPNHAGVGTKFQFESDYTERLEEK